MKKSMFLHHKIIKMLCFLFILSTIFNITSLSFLESALYKNAFLLVAYWIFSVAISYFITPYLYHLIQKFLHLQKQ